MRVGFLSVPRPIRQPGTPSRSEFRVAESRYGIPSPHLGYLAANTTNYMDSLPCVARKGV